MKFSTERQVFLGMVAQIKETCKTTKYTNRIMLNPVTIRGETYHNQHPYQKVRNLSLSGRIT